VPREVATAGALKALLAHSGIAVRPKLLPEPRIMDAIVVRCATPLPIGDVLSGLNEKERQRMLRGVGWLLKFSLIELV
jgi:hypothetical protein